MSRHIYQRIYPIRNVQPQYDAARPAYNYVSPPQYDAARPAYNYVSSPQYDAARIDIVQTIMNGPAAVWWWSSRQSYQ